jgi:V8-like Glu-specific endopeptidase
MNGKFDTRSRVDATSGKGSSTRRANRATRRRVQPVVEGMEQRALLSLSPVSPSAPYPYTAIVELQATFPDHKTFVGSGVMVDKFHVLTAGHMVYSYADGGFASSVLAIPDLYGNQEPFGSARMTYERTFTVFTNYSKAHPNSTAPGDDDIALITLNEDIGNVTGWMSYGYDNNNADFAVGKVFNTAGYPAAGGYNGHYMELSSGAIAGLSSDGSAIDYYQSRITTYAGQSGSPVWAYYPSSNTRIVYGIHVGGSGTPTSLNFATRITQSIYNTIQGWRAADHDPGGGPILFARTATPTPETNQTSAIGTTPVVLASSKGSTAPSGTQKHATTKAAGTPALLAASAPRGPMGLVAQSLRDVRKLV